MVKIYKISYVVIDNHHPGAIINARQRPLAGDIIQLGQEQFEVYEVLELTPPSEGFYHIQAKCKPKPT